MPSIGNTQIKLLERLCNAVAVSGDESEVRQIVLEELKGFSDQVRVDAMGNVLVARTGSAAKRLRVMLSAHMDEVGFMLVADDGEGLFRFEIVGGIDVRQLPGKPVLVGREHVPGVIGLRPIHLSNGDELKRKVPLEALRIDVGPEGGQVKPGDRATFATRFRRSGPALLSKSLDNRFGVATLIELVRNAPASIDLLAAFTVQEEIGLRGARVAAYAFDPDLAIALDATPAYDLPSWDGDENVSYNTRLGQGPAIYVGDGATLSDPRLVRWLAASGDAAGIPYQIRQPGGGGTDAGTIHAAREGIPSASLSVPHRYSHTPVSVARLEDWKNTLALVTAALETIPLDLVSSERK
jgi:endoglucanase